MKHKNTILIIICLLAIIASSVYATIQRKEYAQEILRSNQEIKQSNDSLIMAIKQIRNR